MHSQTLITCIVIIIKNSIYKVFINNFRYYTGLPKNLESWKNLEFDNLGKKKLEKPGILEKENKKLNFEHKTLKIWNLNYFYW